MTDESTQLVAMVTGGTRGLGLALVLNLARSGARVYTVGRRQRSIDRLNTIASSEDLNIHCVQADLTTLGGARRLSKRVANDGPRLDLLIHNAGLLGPRAPLAHWSRRKFDQVVSTNLSAPFDLTKRLLPHLSVDSKVAFVSSGVTTGIRTNWGAYQISKVAMESLAEIFNVELGPTGPIIVIVDPGSIRTDMRAAAYPDEDPATIPTAEQKADTFLKTLEQIGHQQSGSRIKL